MLLLGITIPLIYELYSWVDDKNEIYIIPFKALALIYLVIVFKCG